MRDKIHCGCGEQGAERAFGLKSEGKQQGEGKISSDKIHNV
jgi:hypothetical protein